jgi:serine/threonine protein kinase
MGLHVKLVFAAISFELALGRSVGLWPRRVNRISPGPYQKVHLFADLDSNLKRSVAIKALSAAVAGGSDRLARFQREAEVLASLNHSNITAIYGLEESAEVCSANTTSVR